MAVRIRLKKMGRKHRPFFRVCAMDSRAPRDGRVIEELGIYDPMVRETDARAILKGERIDYWLGVGAQPTPKVNVLIKKYGTEGSHLDLQQAALTRLSTRRADTIVKAAQAAEQAAEVAAKAKEEAEAAAKVKEEEALAEAKAKEEEAARAAEASTESDSETAKDDAADTSAEPVAEEAPSEKADAKSADAKSGD